MFNQVVTNLINLYFKFILNNLHVNCDFFYPKIEAEGCR